MPRPQPGQPKQNSANVARRITATEAVRRRQARRARNTYVPVFKGTKKAVGTLVGDRITLLLDPMGGGMGGMLAGAGTLLGLGVSKNPIFIKATSQQADGRAIAILGASIAIGAAIGFGKASKTVRKSTMLVGKALAQEYQKLEPKKRKVFEKYLQTHKYLIVNWEGRVKGTNKKRKLGVFGRIRLESSKIISGEYLKYPG